MTRARSPGVTARHEAKAFFARATAASVSATPACGSSASVPSVAGSITVSIDSPLVTAVTLLL
jgi:hypothetical protein